ncbi:DPP IV N-terminal domain-containing protein [Candidatus Clavichlamydia salmonicola]|uniref:DPP IV N-terminal domain-containing protein n=1 Tax=Candidatus Clavichlamydia salmonicola TaxID=469812 RepID=UPI001891D96B|nr:DPP IV N-terminal domain-containing protein [Candidatus Clavichlamydia salmonicola]
MFHFWLILFILFAPHVFGFEQELTIHVPVATHYKIPFVMGNVESFCKVKKAFFEKILAEDLRLSEHFTIHKTDAKNNTAVQKNALILSANIEENKVTITIINNKSTNPNKEKIVLSTQFTYFDRRTIHLIADDIVQHICHTPGIASSRIIYSFFPKKPTPGLSPLGDIRLIDSDGAEPSIVSSQQVMNICPSFVPSETGSRSSYFLYVSYQTGTAKIFLKNINDERSQKLICLRGNQLMPTVSQQCNKIAFISDVNGNPDLFLQDFSTKEGPIGPPRQLLTSKNGTQGSPTFDPTGNKIAFVSNRDGTPRIYIVECNPLPGTIPQLISKKNRENTAPTWSPDGSKIAYSSLSKGVRQIWIYDVKTGKEKELTHSPGDKENPSWAPDNAHLVFSMNQNGCSNLYITGLINENLVKITHGPGEKLFPSWEPIL